MTEKTSIWEYFTNDQDHQVNDETLELAQNFKKKIKCSEKLSDITWLKSLLHPSMESQFIRFEVLSIVNHTMDTLICNIEPSSHSNCHQFKSLIGFFNIWWWRASLPKVEFSVQEELMNSFDFLKRIILNRGLIGLENIRGNFYLLLNNPVVVEDASQPNRGLITCKKFLIINE